MAKSLKLKARKFWGLIPTFTEVSGKKMVGRGKRERGEEGWGRVGVVELRYDIPAVIK